MVRCSIKRAIKTIVCLVIFNLIIKHLFFSSNQKSKLNIQTKEKLSKILILSSSYSKTIQRLILFFNELRLSYDYHQINDNTDGYSSQNFSVNRPSMIVIDHQPTDQFYQLIDQLKISLVILLNDQCQNCQLIHSSEMLFENFTYSTMDFHAEKLKLTTKSTTSPFQIQSPNSLIKLLRFNKSLPYFSTLFFRCIGLPNTKTYSQTSIIFIQTKQTLNKIDLLSILSKNQIFLSECLFSYWFIWPLIMDILKYLLSNKYDYYGFNRQIQIDIDDIFLGKKTNDQLEIKDIRALIDSQRFIRNYISNFRYRLGFSGYYFDENNQGDRLLIKEKDEFLWFHHTWKHEKLTNINEKSSLINSTKLNLNFAEKHQLPLDRNYAIAPHHAGIYPINPIVYEIWSRFMNITVTSTENYPYHFDLASNHRGFIYRGLSVLPRQTCGLFTTTRNYTKHRHRLERYLMGGKLFRMILTNPIIIFMSHHVNYGHDHLGNYVFAKLIYLISHWTNIRLINQLSSSELARKYFYQYFPNEQMPVFTNPCDDEILLNLWHGNRSMCRIFPRFLIVGPQKTGTTALHHMLSQHPNIYSSKKNSITYEELQFFSNDQIYFNGIDWYLNQFNSDIIESSNSINFEKSATYFDSKLAIKRIKALLPSIQLIMMLIEPGTRAYSRYQHEIVRTNQTLNFDDLLRLNNEEYHLRERCLQPGHYVEHLRNWFKYFPSKQISIIDGDAFRRDPRPILDDLQISFLQLKNPINSSKLVRYNKKKGFFCPITTTNHFQCLGNSKGRRYNSMSSFARQYLNNYYSISNKKLIEFLQKKNYSMPIWLSDK